MRGSFNPIIFRFCQRNLKIKLNFLLPNPATYNAYRCFMRTEIDVLVIEDCILYKSEQPKWQEGENWRDELELD